MYIFNEHWFKKLAKVISVALAVLFVFLALNGILNVFQKLGWVSSFTKDRTIILSAQGKTTASPDTASFSVSIITRGDSPEEVQSKNTKDANKVLDFLKGEGVDEKDLKTTSYNLFPRYNYIEGRQIPAGSNLDQTIKVVVRDLDKAGSLLSGSVQNGANQVSSISFFIDDPDAAQSVARKTAFQNAQKKAEELAAEAGVRLGKVVSFSESSGGFPPVVFAERATLGVGGGGADVSVQPGEQEITITVTVTFAIR